MAAPRDNKLTKKADKQDEKVVISSQNPSDSAGLESPELEEYHDLEEGIRFTNDGHAVVDESVDLKSLYNTVPRILEAVLREGNEKVVRAICNDTILSGYIDSNSPRYLNALVGIVREGCDFSIMCQEDIKEIKQDILKHAKENKTPILIQVKDKLIMYGDPNANDNWQFTEMDFKHVDPKLPFEKGLLTLIKRQDPINFKFSEILKKGHAALQKDPPVRWHDDKKATKCLELIVNNLRVRDSKEAWEKVSSLKHTMFLQAMLRNYFRVKPHPYHTPEDQILLMLWGLAGQLDDVNTLKMLVEWKPEIIDTYRQQHLALCKATVEANAPHALEFFLAPYQRTKDAKASSLITLSKEELSQLQQEAADAGHIPTLFALMKDPDQNTAALKIFSETIKLLKVPDQEKMLENFELTISKAYRYSPMKNVEELTNAFILQCQSNPQPGCDQKTIDKMQKKLEVVKSDFQKWGCQIARYTLETHERGVKTRYLKYSKNNTDTLTQDIIFGRARYKEVEDTLRLIKEHKLPQLDSKSNLASVLGPHRGQMADLLSCWANKHVEEAYERKNPNAELFRKPRTIEYRTPVSGTYNQFQALIEECARSQPTQFIQPVVDGYDLTYKLDDKELVHNQVRRGGCGWVWRHSLSPVSQTWPRIETLHKEVMDMKINKEKPEDFKLFYDRVVEMIWLLGNTTPMCRGTGKYVEQWLTLAHLHHKLPTPILRTDYPQLDCLDITLPLDVYKRQFLTDFCEPESVHPIALQAFSKSQRLVPASRVTEAKSSFFSEKANESSTTAKATFSSSPTSTVKTSFQKSSKG